MFVLWTVVCVDCIYILFAHLQLVRLQCVYYKNAAARIESMLPHIEKNLSKSHVVINLQESFIIYTSTRSVLASLAHSLVGRCMHNGRSVDKCIFKFPANAHASTCF